MFSSEAMTVSEKALSGPQYCPNDGEVLLLLLRIIVAGYNHKVAGGVLTQNRSVPCSLSAFSLCSQHLDAVFDKFDTSRVGSFLMTSPLLPLDCGQSAALCLVSEDIGFGLPASRFRDDCGRQTQPGPSGFCFSRFGGPPRHFYKDSGAFARSERTNPAKPEA